MVRDIYLHYIYLLAVSFVNRREYNCIYALNLCHFCFLGDIFLSSFIKFLSKGLLPLLYGTEKNAPTHGCVKIKRARRIIAGWYSKIKGAKIKGARKLRKVRYVSRFVAQVTRKSTSYQGHFAF